MMAAERPTLKSIQSSPKLAERNFRPSDFLTDKQIQELHEANARGATIERPYDEIDAFAAEILARFGWQAYEAWQMGEFSQEKALRFIAAERARDIAKTIGVEEVIYTATMGANNPTKGGKLPKSAKHTAKIIKEHIKKAKGAQ